MGTSSSNRYADLARKEEIQRRNRIDAGTRKVQELFSEKYNKAYYDDLTTKANELYKPQQEKQYADTLKQLQYALGGTGAKLAGGGRDVASRAAGHRFTDLDTANTLATGAIERRINSTLAGRRQDVANAEAAVQGQLQVSGDQNAAAAQATNQVAARSADPEWQPLGQLFTDVTAGLATQADLERQGNNRYNLGISNWGNNARRYTTNVGGR